MQSTFIAPVCLSSKNKQYTSSLPLLQLANQADARSCWYYLTQEGHCCRKTFAWQTTTCVCFGWPVGEDGGSLYIVCTLKKNQCLSTSRKPGQPRCLYFSHRIRGLFMSIKPRRIVELCYCHTLTFWLLDCHFNFLRPYLNNGISDAAPVAMANCLPEINHARGD